MTAFEIKPAKPGRRLRTTAATRKKTNATMPQEFIPGTDRLSRILLLVTNLTLGGAEAQVTRLAIELKQLGWEVAVVSLVSLDAHQAELERIGVVVHSLGMRRRIPDPRAIVRLRRIIHRFRPQIVHCHMFHANLLGRICRIFAPIPVLVCTVHNLREASERGGPTWHKEILYRLTDMLSDRTTVICRAAFDRLIKVGAVPARTLSVVENFVDTRRFSPDIERRYKARQALGLRDEFVWLAVGRLVVQKDYPTLLRAVHRLGNKKIKVLIAGGGPLAPWLREMTTALKLDASVQFLGTGHDMLDLYNAADAFVMSSWFEGLSVALLEAASMELPAVVTNVGGNTEIVQPGSSGFLVPAGDETALAAAMTRMRELPPAQRSALGRRAREHCRSHYDSRVVVQKWIDLYEELRFTKEIRQAPVAIPSAS